jgi:hypothetical protein
MVDQYGKFLPSQVKPLFENLNQKYCVSVLLVQEAQSLRVLGELWCESKIERCLISREMLAQQ